MESMGHLGPKRGPGTGLNGCRVRCGGSAGEGGQDHSAQGQGHRSALPPAHMRVQRAASQSMATHGLRCKEKKKEQRWSSGWDRSTQGRGHWSTRLVHLQHGHGRPGGKKRKRIGKKVAGVREGGLNRSAQGRGHWSACLPPRRLTKHGEKNNGGRWRVTCQKKGWRWSKGGTHGRAHLCLVSFVQADLRGLRPCSRDGRCPGGV
jgi:hypothetical protein